MHFQWEENPFPATGDAAYSKHARGGPSYGHRQRTQKMIKIARVVPEMSSRRDRETTDRHTHHNTSQPLQWAKYGSSKEELEFKEIAQHLRNRSSSLAYERPRVGQSNWW